MRLTVQQVESLSREIESIVKRKFGMKVHVGFHPRYLSVPLTDEGDD